MLRCRAILPLLLLSLLFSFGCGGEKPEEKEPQSIKSRLKNIKPK